MLVPCRHLPAAEGCFRAADTPGTAEGPTRAPVGLCWRRQLASQKSTASQIPSSCLMLVVPWWGPWGSATPPWGRAGPGRPGHRHHLPLCGDTAGHKDPHCCDSSWARSDRGRLGPSDPAGCVADGETHCHHPHPVCPPCTHKAGVTPSHAGALGSLPRVVSAPGAERALGSRTSCRRRKEELDDNGGGGEPGCRLMNNATASLSGAADFLFTDTQPEPVG